MNVSFSSFQVVCYWGTWANYRPEGGDKTCFPNIFLSSALFYFGILFKVLPIFRKVHTGPRGRHPLHTSHLQVTVHSSGWQKLCGGTGGPGRKVWTQTKILSPNIRYFVANYDLSRFAHFLEIFGQKSAFLGQKQCFLGKKCTITWYIINISLS